MEYTLLFLGGALIGFLARAALSVPPRRLVSERAVEQDARRLRDLAGLMRRRHAFTETHAANLDAIATRLTSLGGTAA